MYRLRMDYLYQYGMDGRPGQWVIDADGVQEGLEYHLSQPLPRVRHWPNNPPD